MHFRVTGTNVFTFLFVFLSILAMANPLPSSSRDNVALNRLEERQAAALIIAAINDVVQDVITDLIHLESDKIALESNFTQQTVNSLASQYPDKNVLVFHDQKSTFVYSPPDAAHVHHELDLGNILGLHEFTYGYEIFVFDSGTFERAGDGGFNNWAFTGCYSRSSTQEADVTFTQIPPGGGC